jgi:hypothetical protein
VDVTAVTGVLHLAYKQRMVNPSAIHILSQVSPKRLVATIARGRVKVQLAVGESLYEPP